MLPKIQCSLLLAFLAITVKADNVRGHRRLNYELLAGYRPRTLVTGHAAIDLDQHTIETFIPIRSFVPVKALYEQGGHSKPVARITILNPEPPEKPIPSGTIVYGSDSDGDMVHGQLLKSVFWESADEEVTMLIQYQVNKEQKRYVGCQVGGLFVAGESKSNGCFMDEGSISVMAFFDDVTAPVYEFNYTYDVQKDNFNGRTIQGFSSSAFQRMWNCSACPYDDYAKFVKYYNAYDYADKWIEAAFDGKKTTFDNGNVDFRGSRNPSRLESISLASKLLNIWMYVIGTMEHAIDRCSIPCGRQERGSGESPQDLYAPKHFVVPCDETAVQSWDEAAAYYVGSLEGQLGSEKGVMLYHLADEMCGEFRTCGGESKAEDGSTSFVNQEILKELTIGQKALMTRNCEEARLAKERIVKLMAIPLIQATLKIAYKRTYRPDTSSGEAAEVEQAKAATYAAAVLPLVHDCSPDDASIIYQNMNMNSDSSGEVDFRMVKRSLEKTYTCMGVSCKVIGGLWEGSKYSKFAAPCSDDSGSIFRSSGTTTVGKILFVVVSVSIVLGFALVVAYCRRQDVDVELEGEDSSQEQEECHATVREFD